MRKGWIAAVVLCFVIWMGALLGGFGEDRSAKGADRYDHVIQFPKERYPETGSHIQEAIRKGHSDVCTIDRNGADARRQESLKGIPTKPGFDRDEWPMAVCLEGGRGRAFNMSVHQIIEALVHGSGIKSAGILTGNEFYLLSNKHRQEAP